MKRAGVFSFVLLLLSPLSTYGQAPSPVPDRRAAVIAGVVNEGTLAAKATPKVARPFSDRINVNARQHVGAYLIAVNAERSAYGALLRALEAARVDKQVGAPPASSGGTSLAMKGLAPKIFGVAVERGALIREVSGTSLTFRLNPVGVVKALQGAGLVELNDDYFKSAVQRFSARFSLAATFDVSRGPDAGVFTASDQQLASWAARYTIIDRRDPASPSYAALWQELLLDTPYQKSVEALNDALGRWQAYTDWEASLAKSVSSSVEGPLSANGNVEAAAKAYSALVTAELKKLEALPVPDEVKRTLDGYVTELTRVQTSIDKIYKFAGKGPLVTFDLTDKRDVGLPDLYTATGVFEAGLGQSRKTDFTFNGSVSFFTSKPTGIDHSLKSMNFTGQLEHPLGKGLPAPTLTFAARYSFIPNDTLVSIETRPTTTPEASAIAPAPKGHVVFFQGKLTVPIKDSGMKVPISVTASNRSELIKEKDVRGSIGITLDLDTLTSFLTGRP